MKLLLSSLLLASLCALSSWSVSSGANVTQSPDVSVPDGGSVNVTCCWPVESHSGSRLRVEWLKEDLKNNTISVKNRTLQNEKTNCTVLTLTNITRESSGRYVCNVAVEIPVLRHGKGKGTLITVTARRSPETNVTGGSTSPDPIICLAVVPPLLLLALVVVCVLHRRKVRAAAVIYETPHMDSVQAEVDKHSTGSSTGSSQWRQVAVYESLDYFERAEVKPSG